MLEAVVLIPVFAAVFAAGIRQYVSGALNESERGAVPPFAASIRSGNEPGRSSTSRLRQGVRVRPTIVHAGSNEPRTHRNYRA